MSVNLKEHGWSGNIHIYIYGNIYKMCWRAPPPVMPVASEGFICRDPSTPNDSGILGGGSRPNIYIYKYAYICIYIHTMDMCMYMYMYIHVYMNIFT